MSITSENIKKLNDSKHLDYGGMLSPENEQTLFVIDSEGNLNDFNFMSDNSIFEVLNYNLGYFNYYSENDPHPLSRILESFDMELE